MAMMAITTNSSINVNPVGRARTPDITKPSGMNEMALRVFESGAMSNGCDLALHILKRISDPQSENERILRSRSDLIASAAAAG
jgi:hypothetical protein